MSRRSWALFAAMCVIWGVPYLMIRVAVRDLPPADVVFGRASLGSLVLLPIALHRRSARVAFGPVLRRWRPLVCFTVVEVAVPWWLLSDAETKLPSSLTGLLIASVPLIGVVITLGSGGNAALDARRLFGLLLGFGGVMALVGLDLGGLRARALIEVGVVAVGYSIGPMIMARSLSDLPRVPVVTVALGLTAIGYLPVATLQRPDQVGAQAAWAIAGLGLICTALAFVLFFALVAAIGPGRSTVITYVNPAVAVLLGMIFLNERFTVGMAVGFPLILLGSVLAAGEGRRASAVKALPLETV